VVDEPAETQIRAHLARGDARLAATVTIRAYGPSVLRYLRSVLRDEEVAAEVFADFSEHLWKGIGKFRGESSVSTWAYRVAWGAVRRFAGDPYRKRRRFLATGEASQLAEQVRSTTAMHLRTEVKDGIARLRASLSPEEQTLLVDRKLPWKEIARVMAEGDEAPDEPALRKRFERIKARLKKLAEDAGLLGS
jgi:RNA polymerase sigma-70 factor, ECF subfamily